MIPSAAANYLADLARIRLLGADAAFCPARIYDILSPILRDLSSEKTSALAAWLAQVERSSARSERALGGDFHQKLDVKHGARRRAAGGKHGARRRDDAELSAEKVAGFLDNLTRRRGGIYLTPRALAEAMAEQVSGAAGEAVLDLSAGAGTLLAAAIRRAPHLRAVGVEKNPMMALSAAINLAATRLELSREQQNTDLSADRAPQSTKSGELMGSGDQVYIADGLSADEPWCELEGRAAAVLGNPPYLREKGNREFFDTLRARHEHLSGYFGARMDLQYLFFHRAATFLRPGALLVFVTSAYWLSATHARTLSADLARRLDPELLLRVEASGVFSDAPGHHTLLSIFRRRASDNSFKKTLRAVSLVREPGCWSEALRGAQIGALNGQGIQCFEHPVELLDGDNWSLFVDERERQLRQYLQARGTRVGELLQDRQGFVSGADRFARRHRKFYEVPGTSNILAGRAGLAGEAALSGADIPALGAPIFLFKSRAQVPGFLQGLGPSVLRPLIRASQIEANAVYFTPPGEEVALYLDGPVCAEHEALLNNHLGAFRPLLERRREVKTGSMPWYRLHWPRERAEQSGPKLISPRRAGAPRFALDLSASALSSDCTYLLGVGERSFLELLYLMVLLNSELSAELLRDFGKTKGALIEFYAEPLRALVLPVYRAQDGRLGWVGGGPRLERARRACRDAFFEVLDALPEAIVETSLFGEDLLQGVGGEFNPNLLS